MTKRRPSKKINPMIDFGGLKEIMKEGKEIMKQSTEMMKEFNELATHAENISKNIAEAVGDDDSKYEQVESTPNKKQSKRDPDIYEHTRVSQKMTIEEALKKLEVNSDATPAEITAQFRKLQKQCKSKSKFIELYSAFKKLMENKRQFVLKGKVRVENEP